MQSDVARLLSESSRDETQLVAGLEAMAASMGEDVYREALLQLVGKPFPAGLAAQYWREAVTKRSARCPDPCNYIGVRSSLLTYLFQVVGEIHDPRIIEADELADVRHASVTDGLTGLYRQNYFKAHLEQLTERLQGQQGQGLAVVMLDLDHFKQYNDRCGHLAGDAALRQVAEIIQHCVRQGDLAARYGGEEFSLILHRLNLPQACMVVERIRQSIAANPFAGEERLDSGCLTVSGGIAVHPEDGTTATDLLLRADERLYQAKQRRNTVFPLNRDQRRARRHLMQSVVEYTSTFSGPLQIGLSHDLSASGITLACDRPLTLGSSVQLHFRRPFWPEDCRTVAVVRNSGPNRGGLLTRVGLQFEEPPAPITDLLVG